MSKGRDEAFGAIVRADQCTNQAGIWYQRSDAALRSQVADGSIIDSLRMMNASPLCPVCQSSMVLRTARRGSNSGGQFWGCRKYPKCKGIVDTDRKSDDVEELDDFSDRFVSEFIFAHTIYVKPHHATSEVEVWDSRATLFSPNEHLGERAPSQLWAFEYRSEQRQVEEEKVRRLVAVIEKLIGRGRWILLDPELDEYISLNTTDLNNFFRNISRQSFNPETFEFDSPVERAFYESAVARYVDPAILCPQVSLSGATGNLRGQYQVVDFIGITASGPVIIEIDGKDHEGDRQRSVDRERDEDAFQAGMKVYRISAGDLSGSFSKSLETLALISPPKLDAVQFSHTVWVGLMLGIKKGYLPISSAEWLIKIDVSRTDFILMKLAQKVVESFIRFLNNLANLYDVSLLSLSSVIIDIGELKCRINRSSKSEFFTEPISDIATSEFSASGVATKGGMITVHFEPVPLGELKLGHLYYREILLDSPVKRKGKIPEPHRLRPEKSPCEYFLRYLFRHETFREGQWEGIARGLEGKDSLILMPTGHGKSIIYQLVGLLRPGIGLIIDPIISLIDDQIENLKRVGIDRVVGISSQIESQGLRRRLVEEFSAGEFLFCFVAPERFQSSEFRQSLKALIAISCVSSIAIDEAHCVSEWGHDFRTAYLNIGRILREYCKSGGVVPPLMGLTGTASRAVLKDVKREIDIQDFQAVITPTTFNRPELRFEMVTCHSSEKFSVLKGNLLSLPDKFQVTFEKFFGIHGVSNNAGIIFCPHVNGDFGTIQVATQILNAIGVPAQHYSGQPPKGADPRSWNKTKKCVANNFKKNRFSVLAATKAFGMGIDKANVRFTAHFGIPASIESFYQEAGRAGRDRNIAICLIIASNDQPRRTASLLAESTNLAEMQRVMEEVDWKSADDITRVLFFHCGSFRGIEREIENINIVLSQIQDLDSEKPIAVYSKLIDLKELEKAVHRLVTIGFFRDYTIDYSSQRIDVHPSSLSQQELTQSLKRYVENYQSSRAVVLMRELPTEVVSKKSLILSLVRLLVDFIYSVIEMGRRRAFIEMIQVCAPGATDETIRRRILAYLEKSEFDEALETIREEQGNHSLVGRILDEIASPNQANALRGGVARYLGSYPDNPNLLFLRGLIEVMCNDADTEMVIISIKNWAKLGIDKYALPESSMANFHSLAMKIIERHNPSIAGAICDAVFPYMKSRDFYVIILAYSSNRLESTLALRALVQMQVSLIKNATIILEENIR